MGQGHIATNASYKDLEIICCDNDDRNSTSSLSGILQFQSSCNRPRSEDVVFAENAWRSQSHSAVLKIKPTIANAVSVKQIWMMGTRKHAEILDAMDCFARRG